MVCGLGGANGGSVPLFVTIAKTAFERECVGTHARFPVLSVCGWYGEWARSKKP